MSKPTTFDAAFNGAGQKVGVEVWRIEQFKVIKKGATDDSHKGKLFAGDCYIILNTKAKNNALERDIFFWLGADSSQDERGSAAIMTVNLDDSLGGEPTQHREVQGHETDEFLSLSIFKNGITYKEGGVATGFTKVDRDAHTTRLLHIKGRRHIRVIPVKLDPKSMNEGDVFILDAGKQIFQWNGKNASRVEKQKAMVVTGQIKDQERGGKAAISIVDQGADDESAFWSAFGCSKPTKINSADKGGDDEAHSRATQDQIKLYHISDATGSIKVEDITNHPLKKDMLDTNDSYVLDTGPAGVFAWVGKGASSAEKKASMQNAIDFLKKKGYPDHTPVTRVVEGAETPLFKQNFSSWPEANASKPGQRRLSNSSKKFQPKKFNVSSMQTKAEREKASMVDDGSGEIEIWRIEDFKKVPVPKEQYGQFYGGDSYIMLYTYFQNSKKCWIIYFWQGLKSSQDEKGASAILAKDLDDELGGEPVQVRVVQNKEPPHLYAIMTKQFGGMIIHMGGKASGFKNRDDKDFYDTDGTRLFHVKGTNEFNTRAIQVEERAASLNSGDVFILESPKGCWLWFGKGCNGDEREMSKKLAKKLGKTAEVCPEGNEPSEFWEALGGQAAYATEVLKEDDDDYKEPRLFQCSNNRGYFYVEEVFDFDQEDLIEEDVMMLDTYTQVFVWIGSGANAIEKKGALETALEYIKTDTSGRTVDDTSILMIKQGFEPPNFTCHFIGWDADKWSNGKTYEQLKAEMMANNPQGGAEDLHVNVADALDKFTNSRYPIEELRKPTEELPEGVDATQKEQYLEDKVFEELFKMTKSEFNAMPQWKKNNLKKKAKLF